MLSMNLDGRGDVLKYLQMGHRPRGSRWDSAGDRPCCVVVVLRPAERVQHRFLLGDGWYVALTISDSVIGTISHDHLIISLVAFSSNILSWVRVFNDFETSGMFSLECSFDASCFRLTNSDRQQLGANPTVHPRRA